MNTHILFAIAVTSLSFTLLSAPPLDVAAYERTCTRFRKKLASMTAKERKETYKSWSDEFSAVKNTYEQRTLLLENTRMEDHNNLYTLCRLWLSRGRAFVPYKDDIGYVSSILIIRYRDYMEPKIQDYIRKFGTISTPSATLEFASETHAARSPASANASGKMNKSGLQEEYESWKDRIQSYLQSGNPLMAAQEWDLHNKVMWENRESLGADAKIWMQSIHQQLVQITIAYGQAAANIQSQIISGGNSSQVIKSRNDPMEYKCYRCGNTMYGTPKCPQCDGPRYGNNSILLSDPDKKDAKTRIFY